MSNIADVNYFGGFRHCRTSPSNFKHEAEQPQKLLLDFLVEYYQQKIRSLLFQFHTKMQKRKTKINHGG